jgi:ribosomal protein S18 acetylase RimI-like enzyme
MTRVTITHLEMTSATELRPKHAPREGLSIACLRFPMPELNRFFYEAVGAGWHWLDRLPWSRAEWLEYVERPELKTWVVSEAGIPAGYFELEKQASDDVEIVYFGLLPQFVECGIGGWALTQAVQRAWEMDAKRVWLHTCDLDHPRALGNYLARGFRVFKTETKDEDLSGAVGLVQA